MYNIYIGDENMIVMFIGPSSSGKDFFYERALKKYSFNEITLLTTRPKRINEKERIMW